MSQRSVDKHEKPEGKDPEILEEAEVDQELVEEAAKFIQKTLAETVFKGAQEVGSYIFKHFFGGKVERVTSKDPAKDASFAALATRCGTPELPISKTWLFNALGVAVACRSLPASSAFRKLLPSHQTALLPLRQEDDFEKVEKLVWCV